MLQLVLPVMPDVMPDVMPSVALRLVLAALAPLLAETPSYQPALASDAAITLKSAWEPCRHSKYGLFAETDVLRAPKPAESSHTYAAAELAPFLPPAPVAVGATWSVPKDAVLTFLRQFHPSARAELHHGFGAAPGTFACLRAASAERLEILFRAHAEFELAGGVTYTPAQFEGRLVLERASGRPLALRIALPDRDTNVDVNVPKDTQLEPGGPVQHTISADIGWVPRMELTSGAWPAVDWKSSISTDEARARLARCFYAFARLEWLPFERAVQRSREAKKPLHLIVLFGTLDDESC